MAHGLRKMSAASCQNAAGCSEASSWHGAKTAAAALTGVVLSVVCMLTASCCFILHSRAEDGGDAPSWPRTGTYTAANLHGHDVSTKSRMQQPIRTTADLASLL